MFVCTTTTVSFSPNMWAKRFLTTWVTLSRHLNLKFPHRYDSDGASVSEVKNLENHNLIEGLVFKFPDKSFLRPPSQFRMMVTL